MKDPIVESLPDTELLCFKPSTIDGLGAFAKRDLPADIEIIEYLGDRIDKPESLRRCEDGNHYIFALSDEQDLDGNAPSNPARLINHCCDPNCEALLMDDRIWIVARRPIRAGEEITFNYGYGLEDFEDYPCRCGAANCPGYIVAEEFFDVVKARLELKAENEAFARHCAKASL